MTFCFMSPVFFSRLSSKSRMCDFFPPSVPAPPLPACPHLRGARLTLEERSRGAGPAELEPPGGGARRPRVPQAVCWAPSPQPQLWLLRTRPLNLHSRSGVCGPRNRGPRGSGDSGPTRPRRAGEPIAGADAGPLLLLELLVTQ